MKRSIKYEIGLETIEKFYHDGFYFAVRHSHHQPMIGIKWIAWAKKTPIVSNSPMEEPMDEDVWFDFGSSKEVAVQKVAASLPHASIIKRLKYFLIRFWFDYL